MIRLSGKPTLRLKGYSQFALIMVVDLQCVIIG